MRIAALALALTSLPFAAAAQTPPIKPGLWQVHSEREVDGQKAPDMTAQLKDLPPETRRQMEAMMKARGVDASGGGDPKICFDKESLDAGRWRNEQGSCKTDFSAQTPSRWAWKSVCTQPMASTSQGETVFTSPQSYTTKVTTAMTVNGKPTTTRMTMTSKWLAADCGDVKPVKPGMK